MHGLIEVRVKLNEKSLSAVLVDDLIERLPGSKIVVATDRPIPLLSAMRKQWLKKIQRMRIKRACMLSSPAADALFRRSEALYKVRFRPHIHKDFNEVDVIFASADDLISFHPDCQFAYLTYDIPKEKQYMLTAWMPPKSGTVITYEG